LAGTFLCGPCAQLCAIPRITFTPQLTRLFAVLFCPRKVTKSELMPGISSCQSCRGPDREKEKRKYREKRKISSAVAFDVWPKVRQMNFNFSCASLRGEKLCDGWRLRHLSSDKIRTSRAELN